jgi:hypothetical protein
MDGKEVPDGRISFLPEPGNAGRPAWSKIESGRYAIPTEAGMIAGKYSVQINRVTKTGRMISIPPSQSLTEEIAEVIPVRYNRESELKAELKVGENHKDFPLKSRP